MEKPRNGENPQKSEILLIQGPDEKLLIPSIDQQDVASDDLTKVLSSLCLKYNDIVASNNSKKIYNVLKNALSQVEHLITKGEEDTSYRSEISVTCQMYTTIEITSPTVKSPRDRIEDHFPSSPETISEEPGIQDAATEI